jgi:carboxylesterase type B
LRGSIQDIKTDEVTKARFQNQIQKVYYNSMCSLRSAVALLLLLASGVIQAQSSTTNDLTITTNTGTYTGIINGTAPHVRQFLNIAYAVPPVGKLRWLPPRKVTSASTTRFDATQYGPYCSQFISRVPFAYTQFLTQVLPVYGAQNSTAGLFAQGSAEDCLSLAIWTPTGKVKELPVIMFMTGGGFVFNGINVPIQLPYHWVERTRKHIVVTIKLDLSSYSPLLLLNKSNSYRLNIFGFPNARALSSQNLGLLDQRMA